MGQIRNLRLINKFFKFFDLKGGDRIDGQTGNIFVPVITHPILPKIVYLQPTEAQWCAGVFVPAGKKWRIKNLQVIWTSDANAGARSIIFQVFDSAAGIGGGVETFRAISRNFQAASLIVGYQFFPGANNVGSADVLGQDLAIPDFWMTEGQSMFVLDLASIAAGDSLTSFLIVEEEELLTDEFEDRVVP